jgi:hypothetical protein
MKAYATSGQVTGASTKTIISLRATSSRRPKLLQVVIGCEGTPADNVAEFAIRRFTVDGTGTVGSCYQADLADGTPVVTTQNNYTTEPTYIGGNMYEISLNQRATVIWNAPLGAEPSVTLGSGGIGIQAITAPTLPYTIGLLWDE